MGVDERVRGGVVVQGFEQWLRDGAAVGEGRFDGQVQVVLAELAAPFAAEADREGLWVVADDGQNGPPWFVSDVKWLEQRGTRDCEAYRTDPLGSCRPRPRLSVLLGLSCKEPSPCPAPDFLAR